MQRLILVSIQGYRTLASLQKFSASTQLSRPVTKCQRLQQTPKYDW